jgi:hypothetical protein
MKPPAFRMSFCVSFLVLMLAGWARGDVAFWVWNRSTPLTPAEHAELEKAGVSRLYWHLGEIENKTGTWQWKRAPKAIEKNSSHLSIIPVIRLESSFVDPFADSSRKELRADLQRAFTLTGADEWQLDYDAPDRLVADYAKLLGELRPVAPKLTSTALAGWIRLPAFKALQQSVAELCPMFYDLLPDTADALRPLLDESITTPLLVEWQKGCSIPWRLGLPWFSRLTVYGKDGHSLGHFRRWAWDDVVFRRELSLAQPMRNGVLSLGVNKAFTMGRSVLHEGERLVVRQPDIATLAKMEKAAGRDVVYFRLPDGADSDGGSLPAFSARQSSGDINLTLRYEKEQLVLTNAGTQDLSPRWEGDGPQDRGYALEVDAGAAVFREAESGSFWRVGAHEQPDTEQPRAVGVTAATRLTYWFGALKAGDSIRSGILQVSAHGEARELRYRVIHSSSVTPWKTFVVPR